MKKMLASTMALFMTIVSPLAASAETTGTVTTNTSYKTDSSTTTDSNPTSDPATDSSADSAVDPTTGSDSDTEPSDSDDNSTVDEDSQDNEDSDSNQGKKKGNKDKYKGIERALEVLQRNLEDGRGTASDEALQAVIDKLKAMLVQDGTAPTEEAAEEAIEEKIETDVEDGTASEQDVEILVTMKINGKKVDEAQSNLETALSDNPDSDKLYELLSKVLVQKGDVHQVKIYVKGKKPVFDSEPYIKEDRTMVPVAAISDALGADVEWVSETRTVLIKKDGITIELPLDSKTIKVNGEEQQIDAAAEISKDRTMVPVAFISKYLGQEVTWDAPSRTVIVK